MFPDITKKITTILSYLLGYNSNQYVNEVIIGFLSIFSIDSKPIVLYNFSQFLAKAIHEQFVQFDAKDIFKYALILVYLFIYFQGDKFPFTLQKLDEEGNQQLVIFWTSMGMKEKEEFIYKQFIELFVHPTINLMSNTLVPRISDEIVKVLQLVYQATTGDWYLYQNYTESKVYCCDLPPYKLPKYLPIRIFALDNIRQRLNANEVHFVAAKKKLQFKLKAQDGPFICNTRVVGEEANRLLREMKFGLSFTCSYDPMEVISKLRVENKFTAYHHTTNPEIEQ